MAGFGPNYYTKIRNGIVVSNIKLVPGNKLWEDCDSEKGDSYLRNFPGLLITPWIYMSFFPTIVLNFMWW